MTNALLVAVVFLAIVTGGNILLLLAVVRRLRQVQDLVAPPLPLPAVGTTVGPFHAETVDGGSVTEGALAGGPVLVAVLSSTCPACHGLASALEALAQMSPPPVVLVVTDPQREDSALLQALAGLDRVAAVGRDHAALDAFGGIAGFPTILAVRDGVIVSASTSLDEVLPTLRDTPHLTAH